MGQAGLEVDRIVGCLDGGGGAFVTRAGKTAGVTDV